MVTNIKILFGLSMLLAVFSRYNAHQTPKITVPSQAWYNAVVGSEYIAHCESNGPVVWKKRGMEDIQLESHVTQEDNMTVSKLVLKNLTYRFAGFYDCQPLNDTDSYPNGSFYLYVDDPAHLALGAPSLNVNSKAYKPAIVPCRPTAPDVFVKLLTSKRELMANSSVRSPGPDEKGIYFDPHQGFVMPAHLMEPAWFIYICEFNKRGVFQDMNVDLFTDFSYDLPGQEVVTHTEKKIIAKPGDTVVLPVEVFANSQPNITWKLHRSDGEVLHIPKSGFIIEQSNKIRVEESAEYPWETRVIINDISENEEGTYRLEYHTEYMNDPVLMTFHVYVGASEELKMEFPKVIKVGDYRSKNAFCLCRLYKRMYKAKWSFRPLGCSDQSEPLCEMKLSTVNPPYADKVSLKDVLSATVLEVPQFGNITCTIYYENSFVESVTKPVILSEVDDGFEVRKLTEKIDDGVRVTLQCIVSKYLYTDNLYWIRPNGRVIEQGFISDVGEYTRLTKSENEYSYILEIELKNIDRSPRDYSCMAVNKDRLPEFKTYSEKVPVSLPPTFYAKLNNNTLLVPSNSTISLRCDSDGEQISNVRWLKDGIEIAQTKQETLNITNVSTFKDSGIYNCEFSGSTGSEVTFTQVLVYEPYTGPYNGVDMETGNDLESNLSDRVALYCQQHKKSSKINWYKYNEKLQKLPQLSVQKNGFLLVINPVRATDAGLYSCKPEENDTVADLEAL